MKRIIGILLVLMFLFPASALADLRRGDRGEEVRQLQQMLWDTGFIFEEPDGVFGHSERRQYFGETDKTVNLRTRAAVEAGLKPIVCVGELKDEREAGYTDIIVEYQTLMALHGLTATDEQANETIGAIRKAIERQYGKEVSDAVRIQYGGSMNPKNVKGLMAQPEIDGGLIGGASLKAPDFSQVVLYNK